MKRPDEIKKGLECCMDYQSCTEYGEPKCPYNDVKECVDTLLADALAYIQHLEAERDAAVEDMTNIVMKYGEAYCEYCEWLDKRSCIGRCWTHNEGFKWRGVQKED